MICLPRGGRVPVSLVPLQLQAAHMLDVSYLEGKASQPQQLSFALPLIPLNLPPGLHVHPHPLPRLCLRRLNTPFRLIDQETDTLNLFFALLWGAYCTTAIWWSEIRGISKSGLRECRLSKSALRIWPTSTSFSSVATRLFSLSFEGDRRRVGSIGICVQFPFRSRIKRCRGGMIGSPGIGIAEVKVGKSGLARYSIGVPAVTFAR